MSIQQVILVADQTRKLREFLEGSTGDMPVQIARTPGKVTFYQGDRKVEVPDDYSVVNQQPQKAR